MDFSSSISFIRFFIFAFSFSSVLIAYSLLSLLSLSSLTPTNTFSRLPSFILRAIFSELTSSAFRCVTAWAFRSYVFSSFNRLISVWYSWNIYLLSAPVGAAMTFGMLRAGYGGVIAAGWRDRAPFEILLALLDRILLILALAASGIYGGIPPVTRNSYSFRYSFSSLSNWISRFRLKMICSFPSIWITGLFLMFIVRMA